MWSLPVIEALNQIAAREARELDKEPYVIGSEAEIDRMPPFDFPVLHDLKITGWRRTDEIWFVDSTGNDKSGPALSVDAFKEELRAYYNEHPAHGFGIIEFGPFQLYVAAYRPIKRRARSKSAG
ncbi:MAG: hypothetical protein L0312_20085 [Acidobacteria bacterium]|nr:hypothetical protein [Acidobacteriota bacterium]